jgi:UPF0755 protein
MKLGRRIVMTLFTLLLLLGGGLAALLGIAVTSRHSPATVEVEIAPGMGVQAIALELARHKVIATPTLFELWVRARGLGRKLHYGTYEFPAGTTMLAAMDRIERGEVKNYPLTVVEGWTIAEIAAALSGKPWLADPQVPARFTQLARDPAFLEALGFTDLPSLEGFLFPDTYLMTKPVTAEALLKRLTGHFREVWAGLDPAALEAGRMTEREIMTLASIVEKETGAPAERPLIAGVFLNRLRKGMPLQSDPTIIYGLPNFDGNLHKSDILHPHPYNTYAHAGLPPGPICNPGKASIDAVLHPATTDALYFVAKGDGTHQFSATFAEHSAAVQRYQVDPARAGRP